jgi:hypothetical protein
VRVQVSHPYSTTAKITVLYILIFRFFVKDGKKKDFGLNNSKHSLNLIYSWFHHECHSDLLVSSPSIWICLWHFNEQIFLREKLKQYVDNCDSNGNENDVHFGSRGRIICRMDCH